MATKQSDYIRGVACGHKELLAVLVGWLTSGESTGGTWAIMQDYIDNTGSRKDGERNVILRSDIPGELPIYIGLRTFHGYPKQKQAGIQINAYTNFSSDLPWDCQSGSLADPGNYNQESHFYEDCPAILVGEENVCYWIHADAKKVTCTVRTPTVPAVNSEYKTRKSVVYEMFYLGWMQRIVQKEGYPYPMACIGTTSSLGTPANPIQRNFVYDNTYGSPRHLPPFHFDYMWYDGIQPTVRVTIPYNPNGDATTEAKYTNLSTDSAYRFPIKPSVNESREYCSRKDVTTVLNDKSVICGPDDLPTCHAAAGTEGVWLKTSKIHVKMFKYDLPNMANRALYFDGTWGWTCTYPIRNAHVKSLCWCTYRITKCGSHNAFDELGAPPPLSALSAGVLKDQLPAHFGWNPAKIVDSFSGQRLVIPAYVGIVGSITDAMAYARETLRNNVPQLQMYAEEQRRIQIAGVLDGLYIVPGLGLSAQDVLKMQDGSTTTTYVVFPDVYREGPFNFCAMKLGVTEWHEQNPTGETPKV